VKKGTQLEGGLAEVLKPSEKKKEGKCRTLFQWHGWRGRKSGETRYRKKKNDLRNFYET